MLKKYAIMYVHPKYGTKILMTFGNPDLAQECLMQHTNGAPKYELVELEVEERED
jgi:hypothetical protein